MSNIDPQNAQQIVQFLATYGTPAGIAAAQAVGTNAVQALGSGATKAIKSLWGRIRHKSKQEGGIAEEAVTAFEANPHDTEHQQTLSFALKQLCSKDSAFAHEIAQLFNDVQRDPVAGQFIQHISGHAQVGIARDNYGSVTIHQTAHQRNSTPQHQLQIKVGILHLTYGLPPNMQIDRVPTLVVYALNVGVAASYVNRVEFESIVDGHTQVNGVVDFGMGRASHASDKFGVALQPGQKHKYCYHFIDLSEFGTLGREVIPAAVLVYDEIGNEYREPIPEHLAREIMKYYGS